MEIVSSSGVAPATARQGRSRLRSRGPERAADVANVRVVEHRAAARRAEHSAVHGGESCGAHRDLQ